MDVTTTPRAWRVSFTLFPDVHATSSTPGSCGWDVLWPWLLEPAHTYPTKAACPLIKLATFGELRSIKDSLRHDANVLQVWGVECDYDGEQVPLALAAQMLQALNVEALLYSSPSHTPERPRWRILAPLSGPAAPEHRAHYVGLINAALGGVLAGESFTLSQSYYIGRVTGAPFEHAHSVGLPVDQALATWAPLIPQAKVGQAARAEWREAPVPEWSGPTDDDELVQRLLRQPVSAAAAFAGRASFRDLWEGNAAVLARAYPSSSGDEWDRSQADAALAAHLCWGTGNNHERVAGLMLRSALTREKWALRPDYLTDTVLRMAARTTKWLCDRPAAVALAGPPPATGGSFVAAAAGAIPATLVNVQAALRSDESGVKLAYDEFRASIVLGAPGGWRPLEDVDYVKLRTAFEERGFKPVSSELMRDACLGVAKANPIDTAQQWLGGLQWDGVPRVDTMMRRYFGAAATPYGRAVGRYLMTALAARVVEPGCQVDMVPVLIGPEGLRKTSSVAALAPAPEAFAEFHLDRIDDNTSRSLRGCLVGELSELKGLKTGDAQAIRAWITKRHEAWVPKYQEFATRFPRRCVFIGTSNPRDILNDPEGHRRWLPIDVTRADDQGIAADRDQLWAEGAALWRAHGVLWQEAQELARQVHGEFEEVDDWHDQIAATLDKPRPAAPGEIPRPVPLGAQPFTLTEVARIGLGLDLPRVGSRENKRIGAILRKLGYLKGQCWINGRNVMAWRKASDH